MKTKHTQYCHILIFKNNYTCLGSTDAVIRIWNMDGQQSIPMWRGGDMPIKGPDMLKSHTDSVVGLAACKRLVCMN